MKHAKPLRRTFTLTIAACLLCVTIADAKKPDNPGGGGGGGGEEETSSYTVIDLLGIPGGSFLQSRAQSLSEPDGQGAVFVAGGSHFNGDPHAVSWEVNSDESFVLTHIGLPPGATDATATDANLLGIITVNTDQTTERDNDGNLVLPAWVQVPGLPLQQLPMNGSRAEPHAINVLGEIVGINGGDGALWTLDADGVPGNPVNLGGFTPYDINDQGMMAGDQVGLPAVAWFDNGGALQVLNLLRPTGYTWGSACAISQSGDWAAGTIRNPDGHLEAFVAATDTGMIQPLGTLGGHESVAFGVNSNGDVVGWSATGGGRYSQAAYVRTGGVMHDLNSLVDSKNHLQFANSINDAGNIVGFMRIPKPVSESHGYFLKPVVPSP